jgi:hypothetical protein
VVLGVVVIAVQPDVLHWAVVFLPLLAFSLWRETLLSGIARTAAINAAGYLA